MVTTIIPVIFLLFISSCYGNNITYIDSGAILVGMSFGDKIVIPLQHCSNPQDCFAIIWSIYIIPGVTYVAVLPKGP